LALALQFGCALRQKDVIGEWVKAHGGEHWTSGLLWGEHVKADWTLEKPTSKSNFSEVAEFDLRLFPTVMEELQRVPATSRIGPVILDERTGKGTLDDIVRLERKADQAVRALALTEARPKSQLTVPEYLAQRDARRAQGC
jgi:hypothetical protein